jgi:hypothetical protein
MNPDQVLCPSDWNKADFNPIQILLFHRRDDAELLHHAEIIHANP